MRVRWICIPQIEERNCGLTVLRRSVFFFTILFNLKSNVSFVQIHVGHIRFLHPQPSLAKLHKRTCCRDSLATTKLFLQGWFYRSYKLFKLTPQRQMSWRKPWERKSGSANAEWSRRFASCRVRVLLVVTSRNWFERKTSCETKVSQWPIVNTHSVYFSDEFSFTQVLCNTYTLKRFLDTSSVTRSVAFTSFGKDSFLSGRG